MLTSASFETIFCKAGYNSYGEDEEFSRVEEKLSSCDFAAHDALRKIAEDKAIKEISSETNKEGVSLSYCDYRNDDFYFLIEKRKMILSILWTKQ